MMNLNLTSLLAFYGATLSSFGMGWNFYRDLRDRAKLTVSMNIRRIANSPDGKWYQVKPDLPVQGASGKLFLVVNVTNVGRRPVKWTGWGGEYKKPRNGRTGFWIQPTHIPLMLPEGESSSEFTDDLQAAGPDVKKLFVFDATGKNWYLSWRALRKLKKDCIMFQKANRSYKAIRRENGKPDVVTHFPCDASPVDAVGWCEADGYTVIGHEIIDTPQDEKCQSTTIVTVQPKP